MCSVRQIGTKPKKCLITSCVYIDTNNWNESSIRWKSLYINTSIGRFWSDRNFIPNKSGGWRRYLHTHTHVRNICVTRCHFSGNQVFFFAKRQQNDGPKSKTAGKVWRLANQSRMCGQRGVCLRLRQKCSFFYYSCFRKIFENSTAQSWSDHFISCRCKQWNWGFRSTEVSIGTEKREHVDIANVMRKVTFQLAERWASRLPETVWTCVHVCICVGRFQLQLLTEEPFFLLLLLLLPPTFHPFTSQFSLLLQPPCTSLTSPHPCPRLTTAGGTGAWGQRCAGRPACVSHLPIMSLWFMSGSAAKPSAVPSPPLPPIFLSLP